MLVGSSPSWAGPAPAHTDTPQPAALKQTTMNQRQAPPVRQIKAHGWKTPLHKVPSGQESEYDTFPICWVLLHGTVGTLQPAKGGKARTSQGWSAGVQDQDGTEHWELTFLH